MTVHEDAEFDALAKDLTVRTGVSLASYKPKCLRRRIAVRMRACGVHTYDEYRGVLASTPGEVDRLHDALTINVTRFYRNPETWEAVKANVLPGLMAKAAPVRVWSAGCSSGEEAHTLSTAELPAHQHQLLASADFANANGPGNAVPAAKPRGGPDIYAPAGSAVSPLNPQAVATAGGGQPHQNMQPFLTLNFVIAAQGIFPSRN